MPRRIPYSPALDGLRAFAVAAVLLYHGAVPWAPGGFLGVDVFFVLSGYLITSLLLEERRTDGRVALRAFWGRRARRLLPALLVVLAATTVAVVLVADPADRRVFRGDALAALGYVANWRFVFSRQSYFDSFGSPSWVRHMWSLGIEEQWYLVWPLVVAGTLRLTGGRRWPLAVVATVATATSVGAMVLLAAGRDDPSRAYYGTDARAQALLVGALLALALPALARRARRPPGADVVGFVAVAGLVAFAARVSDLDAGMYRGGFLAVAVAAAFAVAAAVGPATGPYRRALAARPLVLVGRVSYGVYLWHWPVFLLLTPARAGIDGAALFVLRAATTLAVAAASYRFVEQPIRTAQVARRRTWRAPVAAIGASVVLASAVVAVPAVGLVPERAKAGAPTGVALPAGLADYARAQAAAQAPPDLRLLLVGDSVAWNLGWTLGPDDIAGRDQLESRARIGCGIAGGTPLDGGRPLPFRVDCRDDVADWRSGVEATRPQVALVVVGAWEVLDRRVAGRVLHVGTEPWRAHVAADLDRHLDALTSQPGTRVVLATVPCFDVQELRIGGIRRNDRGDPRRVAAVNQLFRSAAAARAERVAIADLAAFLCPGGRPRHTIDGDVVREPDGVHLTPAGAHAVWRWLGPQLRAAAGLPST